MSITLDFTNCLSESIGATHGLTKSEVDTLVAKFPKHHENIEEVRTSAESGFFELPYADQSELKALLKKHQGKWENLVIVGVGGSALAARTLVGALAHRHHNLLDPKARKNAPRVFILDNADPRSLADLLETVDLKKTLVQIVGRSGVTAETMSLFLLVADALKKKVGKTALTSQVIITTDREKSPLAEIAKVEKIDLLPISANLTGRYGLIGNQGLFTAGMVGLSVENLLKGAADMDARCRHGDPYKNPAYMHSLVHYLLTRKRRKTMHVTFSFNDRLHEVGRWYDHFCSVSLGKMLNRKGKAVHVGPSPVSARGSYDLHGQEQLFAEGPFDKVTTFMAVKDHGATAAIPGSYAKIEAASYLKDLELGSLLTHGYWAAEQHMTAAGRPNMTLHLDAVDEHHVGGLIYLFQLSTAMSAELYGINPFDQPAVEHNKAAMFAQLGRSGFEDLSRRIKDYKTKPRKTC